MKNFINLNADCLKIKIEQLHNKNQFVVWYIAGGIEYIAFQSYNTLIAVYQKGDYKYRTSDKLYINWNKWDYSKTTLKHLKMFINEYTSFNYENKQQFLNELMHDDSIYLFK